MSQTVTVKLPNKQPAPVSIPLTTFQAGVVTLINESNLTATMLKEATNIMLYEKGAPGPRWGTAWYGTAMPNGQPIDGATMYVSAAGVNQIVAVAGGSIYQSINNGATWTICTGGSFTAGKKVYFEQGSQSGGAVANYMYLSNGYDYPIRYDGSTTLIPFAAITPPSTPTVVATGIPTGVYSSYYRIAAVNAVGTTQGTSSVVITSNTVRAAWDPTHTGTHYMTLSWAAVVGAVRYDVYLADNAADDAANNNYYLDSVGATASPGYVDNGQVALNPNTTVPIQNTTGAPRCREFISVGSRLYGTQDRDYPYRVWFSGSGPFMGYFSDSYDGGYIDLQRGSQFFPVKVADYRDGKGTPLATIWCDSADSRGCVWQLSLTSQTILNTQFTQPSANKLPGSRGTTAPNSVVNVLNDYMFFNYQAVYNLGSRAQFLNLLSTDESTANIRPTLTQNISPSAASGVCAYYYLAKVFVSVPFNGTTNNNTMVYDTERHAWLPNAYNIGMERLFQYTDSNKVNHLLFWKPGDMQLSETSSSITGDYGVGFLSSLTTGLIPTVTNRFGFLTVNEGSFEFANAVNNIAIELIGIERTKGYSLQKTVNLTPVASNNTIGWDTFAWDTTPWDNSGIVGSVHTEASEKRYFIVGRDLNAFQYHITSNAANSQWILRTLQIDGVPSNNGKPQSWRLRAF